MLRVLIVDDDDWVRRSLGSLLAKQEGFGVVGVFSTGRDAIRFVREGGVADVAIVDLGLPDEPGTNVIAAIRRALPETVALAFTVFDDAAMVFAALKAGARGYLLKSMPFDRLVASIREARAGGSPMTPSVARLVIDAFVNGPDPLPGSSPVPLSPRETEVLRWLAKGVTYAQVATALGIGLGTVQSHVKSIYEKLEVSSKAEAAAIAVKLGIA